MFSQPIPLSLYIHIPWCLRKCPYCDFNSHEQKHALPEKEYVNRLLADVEQSLPLIWGRPLRSIFIGGGTPSLFSPESFEYLFSGLHRYFVLNPALEITMEANPGTFEQEKFKAYRSLGINRLSLGIQSFHNTQLKALGRIHDGKEAFFAASKAKAAGFDNINLDLMFGLPEQTLAEALKDLEIALSLQPEHLSWYQLTLEPNTWFYRHPPLLPEEEILWNIQEQGQALLYTSGFKQYEVSAYTPSTPCQHNVNYWEFGDYLGIGAGAHSKITDVKQQTISRFVRIRHPKEYLDPEKPCIATSENISNQDRAFEFMLNALRLAQGFPQTLFQERTGLTLEVLEPKLTEAINRGLLLRTQTHFMPSPLGYRFLNELVGLFLPTLPHEVPPC